MEQNNNIVNNNSNVQNNTNYYKGNTQRNNQKAYTEKDYIRDYNRKLKKFRMQLIGRNVKENLKALAIMTLIILIIWFFPPTHKLIINLYEENIVLQTLVDIIKKIFISIKQSIFG